jgi:hypothetical protein
MAERRIAACRESYLVGLRDDIDPGQERGMSRPSLRQRRMR